MRNSDVSWLPVSPGLVCELQPRIQGRRVEDTEADTLERSRYQLYLKFQQITYEVLIVRKKCRTIKLSYIIKNHQMAIQIDPTRVIGRDRLIERIWRKLETKSLLFTAERRIGKTTVMTKMVAEPKDGFRVVFMELEGVDSAEQFAEVLLNKLLPLLSKTDKAKTGLRAFWEGIGGVEVGGVIRVPGNKLGWQATIEKTLERVCDECAGETILLLMDEVPYMLQKIASQETGNNQKTLALTMLDVLRSMRQQKPNLRMIFSGSIGLHHVVSDLRQEKIASEPVNDMPLIEIHSLAEQDGIKLARRLLGDEAVCLDEPLREVVCLQIAKSTDSVPFYIEAVCMYLADQEEPINSVAVDKAVLSQLTNDHDPWEMEHFRTRLETYYEGTVKVASNETVANAVIARAVLDHLAVTTDPQSIDQVWSAMTSQFSLTEKNHLIHLLRSLTLDHYLVCNTDKQYAFRFPLIRHWWSLAQGLN